MRSLQNLRSTCKDTQYGRLICNIHYYLPYMHHRMSYLQLSNQAPQERLIYFVNFEDLKRENEIRIPLFSLQKRKHMNCSRIPAIGDKNVHIGIYYSLWYRSLTTALARAMPFNHTAITVTAWYACTRIDTRWISNIRNNVTTNSNEFVLPIWDGKLWIYALW